MNVEVQEIIALAAMFIAVMAFFIQKNLGRQADALHRIADEMSTQDRAD